MYSAKRQRITVGVTRDRRRISMGRRVSVFVVAALVATACGGGDESAAESATDAPVAAEPTGEVAAPAPSGGSDFCDRVLDVVEEAADQVDEDASRLGDLYTFMLDIFTRIADEAPGELEADFELVVSALAKYTEWIEDPLQPEPLDAAEQAAFEAANDRINTYIEEECGIDMGTDDDAVEIVGVDEGNAADSTATQTITLAGTIYQETLSGASEVSCDLYGDLETGSIGIYLDGPDFQSSVSSYDSGVEPGTYLGSIWVFASDLTLDELAWDLQEIDGEFVLTKAEEVSDEEWLFVGSFSAAVEDPPASIQATFSCVGLTGY